MNVSGTLKPVLNFEPMGLPIGKAAALEVGAAVGDVLQGFVSSKWNTVPQWAVGIGASYAVIKVKAVREMLGPEAAELVALGILSATISEQLNLRTKTRNAFSRLFGGRTTVHSPPEFHPDGHAQLPSGSPAAPPTRSADIYAGLFR